MIVGTQREDQLLTIIAGPAHWAHRFGSRFPGRESIILVIILRCCTFMRLHRTRRGRRDGRKGARALNKDKEKARPEYTAANTNYFPAIKSPSLSYTD